MQLVISNRPKKSHFCSSEPRLKKAAEHEHGRPPKEEKRERNVPKTLHTGSLGECVRLAAACLKTDEALQLLVCVGGKTGRGSRETSSRGSGINFFSHQSQRGWLSERNIRVTADRRHQACPQSLRDSSWPLATKGFLAASLVIVAGALQGEP